MNGKPHQLEEPLPAFLLWGGSARLVYIAATAETAFYAIYQATELRTMLFAAAEPETP